MNDDPNDLPIKDNTPPAEQPNKDVSGHKPAEHATPSADLPPTKPARPNPGAKPVRSWTETGEQLAIPILNKPNPRVQADRKRLRHRRKRFTLYVMRTNRRRHAQHVRARGRAIWMTVGIIFALILALAASTVEAAVSYYQQQKVVLDGIQAQVADSDSVRIFDRYGTLLYQFNSDGIKHSICYDQMPVVLRNATVAVEDKNFWTNQGIDPQRILSAGLKDYQTGQVQEGASTITQQLIKQTVLNADVTFDRKIKEAILAIGITITGQYSKQQILAMYLNTIPYGPYIYGVDAAAHAYFNYTDDPTADRNCNKVPRHGHVAAEKLTLAQSSFLAGIPENPNAFNPMTSVGFANALTRQRHVLDLMVEQHYITSAQADAAWKESHKLNFLTFPPQIENKAPHFVEYVRNQLAQMIDTGQLSLSRSGLSVYTTLDLPLQNKVQQYIRDHLFGHEPDEFGGYIRNDNASDAAAMLADQKTGDLLVLLGSWDYNATATPFGKPINGKFNVATQGFRQSGSTFKPLVYSAAFEKGWFPAMTVNDTPTVFPVIGTNDTYKPLNADRGRFDGVVTLRQALQYSIDIPAVKVMQFVGVNDLENFMARMGITAFQGTPGLSSALGALEIHPIDLLQAYTVLANYGRRVPLNAIDHIDDAQGNTIYRYAPPRGVQVIDPRVAYLMTSVLTDNVTRTPHFGVCSPLRMYTATREQCLQGNPGVDYIVASKTGTTDDLTNDLTYGYTVDYTGGVWVGNTNEGDGMYHISGITGAGPIWNKMMLWAEGCTDVQSASGLGGTGSAAGCRPTQPFPVPSDVVRATYSSNGKTTTDWFLANNVPQDQGTGNGGPTGLCINIHDGFGHWDYCGGSHPSSPATPPPGAPQAPRLVPPGKKP